MLKLAFTLSLLTGLLTATHPKDITGKWVVDHVETGDTSDGLPPQQKQRMAAMMKTYFKNASFILRPDHKCVVNINIPAMPKINYWNYDAAKGIIILSEAPHTQSKIMVIEVTEQSGGTFFSLQESTAVLKVHKAS